jgi:histidyl-tRNA synthetase
VTEILTGAGLDGFKLLINSVGCPKCRPVFVNALRERLEAVKGTMCNDCQRRAETNPLRVLDCKVPEDQPIIEQLPSILDSLDDECRSHFERVRTYLTDRGIDFEIRPRLVRGLDYYMRTTFEIVHGSLGAQNSVLGGGRYDGLAEALGSKVHSPGIGFSIGEDRLVMSVEEKYTGIDAVDLFIAPMGESAFRHCSLLAREIRRAGTVVELAPSGGKLKKQLETADKVGARSALIVGDDEIAAETYTLKDMRSGEQQKLTRAELIARFVTPQEKR